ncbi:putative wd40 protein [Trichoderma sp. SZMC 28012]
MTDRNLYTVGWICAIHTELVAALALLDERHNRPTELDPNDSNNYQLGKISGHYVAIACLPDGEQGIAAAAGAATNLLRSFPNIRFGLMVGTGGGAPTLQNDIRLGDVVVSTPKDGKGGVFQYDFGKTMQDNAFIETGFLDQPPSLLRSAVAGLKAEYEMDGHTLTEEVNTTLERKPRLQKTYSRPQTGDILYKSAYTHISGPWEACEACDDDPSNCIPRRPRDENDDDPVIHYGLIASANQRMENAILRDKLAMDKGVLCFEMEAAGLMNHFPCLIIRGICDYADTHKNNKWRGYASMTAAAYARDLISRLLPDEVQKSKTANEILLSLTDHMSELTYNTDKIAHKLDLAKLSIAEGAEYGSYADQHEDECLQGTRTKILHDIEEWATTLSSKCIFWLNGMAGTGKSTISRTVARLFQAKQLLGASFFFKKGEVDRGNATRFFSTIASQLQIRIPGMGDELRKVIDSEPQISTKSLKEQFERLILEPISCLKAANSQPSFLVVIIDALDECDNEKDIQVLLNLIPQLQACSSMHFRVFITSRPDLPIRLGFENMKENDYQDLILHQIPEADIERDIRFFLKYRLDEIRKSRMLSQEWPGETNINTLTTISTPLFIFAATMCRVFEDYDLDPKKCLDEYLEYKAEDSKLDAVYLPVLNRICAKYSDTDRRKDQFIQDVREVVSAIILLKEPLPIASLSKLIDISTEAIRSRLNSLHSVLNVPKDESKPIRIFHLSFHDFLLDPKTPGKTAIWVDKGATNQKLAMQCLNIMRTYLKKNICSLPNYAINQDDIPDETVSQHLSHPLGYSCLNWGKHWIRSQSPRENLQSFLEMHLLHWMEAMAISNHVSQLIKTLTFLRLFTRDHDDYEVSEFLYDALRYVLRNERMITENPLQIYVSGLLFAPTASVVKQQFSGELPGFISMTQNVDSSWGAELGELMRSENPTCVALSPTGDLLAAGFLDMTIRLWETTTGVSHNWWSADETVEIRAVAFSQDEKLLASCSAGPGKLQFWDHYTGTLLSTFDEDVDGVTSLVFTDKDQLRASPSKTWDFLTWDHATGIQHHTLTKPLSEDARTKFSPDGLILAVNCDEPTIDLWDIAARNLQHTLMGHANPILSLCFSADGRLLASGDDEGTIIIWDTATGVQREHIMKHMGPVFDIAFSPEEEMLASIHKNFNFRMDKDEDEIAVWDLGTYSLTQILRDKSGTNYLILFYGDYETLVSIGGSIRLWDATDVSQNRHPHSSHVISVVFSSDGQLLATVCGTGRILIWNVTSETIIQNLGDRYNGNILAFSSSNRLLAFSSSPRVIELWNINTEMQQFNINAFGEVYCISFSSDDQLIACLVDHRFIEIWDLTTGTLRNTISDSQCSSPINSIKFSSGGEYLGSSTPCLLPSPHGWLIEAFRLSNTDIADLIFWVSDVKIHFSRGHVNRVHGFPIYGLETPQGDLDGDMVSKGNDERRGDMLNLAIDDEWLCYEGKKVLWLPDDHQASCWASNSKTIAIGHASEGVTIIKISPQSGRGELS